MSLSHHGVWDRIYLAFGGVHPPGPDAIPRLGAFRTVAFHGHHHPVPRTDAFRIAGSMGSVPLGSRRFRTYLRRYWMFYLLTIAAVAAIFWLLIALDQPLILVLFLPALSLFPLAWRIRERGWRTEFNTSKAVPLLTTRLARQAILYSSPRFRYLHVTASARPTAEQVCWYVQSRREFWQRRLDALSNKDRQLVGIACTGSRTTITACVMMAGVGALYLLSPRPGTMLFFFPLIYLPIGADLVARHFALKRLRRDIENDNCPDCHYPLGDFTTGTWRGEEIPHLGPRRCPECGAPWPLLPPPVVRKVV